MSSTPVNKINTFMIMDTYMFLIPVVAIIIICLMVLYARYVGRKSRGRYAAAAMRFIEKDYPEIDIRDKRYLSTRVDYNIISRHVPVLVVYNSHELHLVPILFLFPPLLQHHLIRCFLQRSQEVHCLLVLIFVEDIVFAHFEDDVVTLFPLYM